MNYNLLPTLKHAAIVRIASLLYDDYEIEKTLRKTMELKRPIRPGRVGKIKIRPMGLRNQQWVLVEAKITDLLSSILPPLLRKAVGKFMRAMHDQVHDWKRDHDFLLEHVGPRCCTWLLWKTDGTISKTQTAKEIVANDDMDPKGRFVMACTYFLEDEVMALWKKIKKVDNSELALESTNAAVRFWMDWLQNEDGKHWSEMIDEYFGIPRIEVGDIPLRLSSFYHFLSRATKQEYIRFFEDRHLIHIDDFQMCVNKMDETERAEILQYKSRFALTACLRWPFRILFLKMAKEVFSYLTVPEFRTVLHEMIFSFSYYGDEAFHLFEEFWQMSPAAFKNETKKFEYFIMSTKSFFDEENPSLAVYEIWEKIFLHL